MSCDGQVICPGCVPASSIPITLIRSRRKRGRVARWMEPFSTRLFLFFSSTQDFNPEPFSMLCSNLEASRSFSQHLPVGRQSSVGVNVMFYFTHLAHILHRPPPLSLHCHPPRSARCPLPASRFAAVWLPLLLSLSVDCSWPLVLPCHSPSACLCHYSAHMSRPK